MELTFFPLVFAFGLQLAACSVQRAAVFPI
jgi:hypothetical protein